MRKSSNHGMPRHCGLSGKHNKIDAIIVDFSKVFDLVPLGRLLTNTANSGVDSRVVLWIRKFPLRRTQRVNLGRQLTEEVRVTSGVPQGSVLCPLCS